MHNVSTDDTSRLSANQVHNTNDNLPITLHFPHILGMSLFGEYSDVLQLRWCSSRTVRCLARLHIVTERLVRLLGHRGEDRVRLVDQVLRSIHFQQFPMVKDHHPKHT